MKGIYCSFLIFIFFNSFSQVSLKLMHIRPTGEFGMVFKPTFSADLFYKGDYEDDGNFIPRLGIGFVKFTPRLESFPVIGVIGNTVVPGTMSYSQYNFYYAYVGVDYEFKVFKSFYMYPGMDVAIGGVNIEYQSNYPLIINEGYTGSNPTLGFKLRTGAEYIINEKIAVLIEANRSMNIVVEQSFMAYNEYSIGVRYYFN